MARGNAEILQTKKLALFCSRKCPGNLILKAYDLARSLREAGTTVISGFHTPVEKECLRILLSPFGKKHRRMTAALAEQRNQFIVSIADDLLFIHAAVGSQTEHFAQNCFQQGAHTYALDRSENQNLLDVGIIRSNARLLS